MLVDILEQPRFHSVFSSPFERMAAFGQYVLKIKPCRQKLAMNIFNNMRPLQLVSNAFSFNKAQSSENSEWLVSCPKYYVPYLVHGYMCNRTSFYTYH